MLHIYWRMKEFASDITSESVVGGTIAALAGGVLIGGVLVLIRGNC